MINKIANHLKNGGQVYETQLDMFVLAYLDNPNQKYVMLGDLDSKLVYLQIGYRKLGELDFVFIDKEEQ